ncbi:transmembrane channel-like protein 6, partial [Coregonus clupeaformis]|uniref:transmembrane channel-like protein 6 n=1 Tax=Coregonus clupeaformis TaxID=59861 RepID=UPI001E1C4366
MPSRTIGRSRGAIISQYCNKTMKLRRRRQSRPSIKDFSRSARPSIRGYGVETGGVETEGVEGEGRKRDHLVNNLQNLSLSDRVRMLRAMPLSVAEKSELRRLADRKGLRSKHSQIPCCSQLKYNIINVSHTDKHSQIPCCSQLKYNIINVSHTDKHSQIPCCSQLKYNIINVSHTDKHSQIPCCSQLKYNIINVSHTDKHSQIPCCSQLKYNIINVSHTDKHSQIPCCSQLKYNIINVSHTDKHSQIPCCSQLKYNIINVSHTDKHSQIPCCSQLKYNIINVSHTDKHSQIPCCSQLKYNIINVSHTDKHSQIPCCSQLKYNIINVSHTDKHSQIPCCSQLKYNIINVSHTDKHSQIPCCSQLKYNIINVSHTDKHSQIPCCSQLKYNIINALRHSWYSCLSFLHSLQLWQVALKRVSGRFGTGVLSYFLFVKTLLFFNIFLFLVTVLFLALPQAVHPPRLTQGHVAFSGLELLTGGGYFSDSVMYYGYYSNSTLYKNCSISSSGMDQQPSHSPSKRTMETDCGVKLSYNMPLAYFFTIGGAFFITCIILVYSMSKSFGQSFRIDKSHGILAMKVFTSWDFKVIKKTSVKLRSENICTQLKELLEETNRKHVQKTVCQRIGRVTVHGLAWFICIGSTVACVLALYYFSEYMHKDLQYRSRIPTKDPLLKEASLLALPVVVSLINLLLPGLFNATAWMEEYDSPSVHTYVSISRNLMLKVSVLVVLCFHWLGRIASDPNSIGLQCWESFVGQELYRFLLMDFIFTILDTFFGEFLWRLFSQRVLKRKRKPVFDIARNVLELIYGQTLAWLGV